MNSYIDTKNRRYHKVHGATYITKYKTFHVCDKLWVVGCFFAWLCAKLAKINCLVQDCSNSVANALKLLQSCIKPLRSHQIIMQSLANISLYLAAFTTPGMDPWVQCDKISTHPQLTYWGRDKMVAIFQTTFSNAFSWMKMLEFQPQW